jgi:molecular chaperone DnaK
LQAALKGTDNDDEVRTAMNDLNEKASTMGQAVYQAAQQAQASAAPGEPSSSSSDDDVVDAEIVDDDEHKD